MKPQTVSVIALMIIVVLLSWFNPAQAFDVYILPPPGYVDLVVDESRGVIYGSGGRIFGDEVNRYIDIISMVTGQVQQQVLVGDDPAGIDMSPDGKELAIALYGEGKIIIMDLDTYTTTAEMVPEGTDRLNVPWDVLYGRAGRLYSTGSPYGHSDGMSFDYVHVYDTTSWMEISRSTGLVVGMPWLTLDAARDMLYTTESWGDYGMTQVFDVTTDHPGEPSEDNQIIEGIRMVCRIGTNLYSNTGQVWSEDLTTSIRTLPLSGNWIACSEENQQVCFTEANNFACYDLEQDKIAFDIKYAGYDLDMGIARYSPGKDMWYVSTNLGIKMVSGSTKIHFSFTPISLNNYCSFSSLYDPFDHDYDILPIGEDTDLRTEILDGEYRILTKTVSKFYRVPVQVCGQWNYTTEVTIHLVQKSDARYGLIFAAAENGINFNYLEIKPGTQTYTLFEVQKYGWYTRGAGNIYHPSINPDTGKNRIRVDHIGNDLYIYINGVLIIDTGLSGVGGPPYWVELAVSSASDQAYTDVRFDDFLLVRLDDNGLALQEAASNVAPDDHDYVTFPLEYVDQPWLNVRKTVQQ